MTKTNKEDEIEENNETKEEEVESKTEDEKAKDENKLNDLPLSSIHTNGLLQITVKLFLKCKFYFFNKFFFQTDEDYKPSGNFASYSHEEIMKMRIGMETKLIELNQGQNFEEVRKYVTYQIMYFTVYILSLSKDKFKIPRQL